MGEQVKSSAPLDRARMVRRHVLAIGFEALAFAPRAKIDATIRGWLGRADRDPGDPAAELALADALSFATDLAMVLPSASGTTAIDRLLRHRKPAPDEADAFVALRQMRYRLVRIRAMETDRVFRIEDVATGEMLRLFDDDIPAGAVGLALALRLCPVAGTDLQVSFGAVLPLDDAGYAVAAGFIRPGAKGLVNPHRCAEALYRHVLRHGGPEIRGINRPLHDPDPAGDFPYGPEDGALDALAFAWAALAEGEEPAPDSLAEARALANLDELVEAVSTACFARHCGRDDLAGAYDLHSSERRSGTNSFQIGLAHGIVGKLDSMRREREAAMVRNTGRDLVPIKESVVDEELARLGIRFRTRARKGGRTVLSDAYAAGHEAGQSFEVHHGIAQGGGRRKPRR